MGLTTWKGAQVRKTDAAISKNYLTEAEVAELNRLTTMFLDFAEDRARRRQPTLMAEWVAQTDRFLGFNERSVLSGPGRVSASAVEQVIAERYAEFDEPRRALEAEQSAADELQDLQELADVERRASRRGSQRMVTSLNEESLEALIVAQMTAAARDGGGWLEGDPMTSTGHTRSTSPS